MDRISKIEVELGVEATEKLEDVPISYFHSPPPPYFQTEVGSQPKLYQSSNDKVPPPYNHHQHSISSSLPSYHQDNFQQQYVPPFNYQPVGYHQPGPAMLWYPQVQQQFGYQQQPHLGYPQPVRTQLDYQQSGQLQPEYQQQNPFLQQPQMQRQHLQQYVNQPPFNQINQPHHSYNPADQNPPIHWLEKQQQTPNVLPPEKSMSSLICELSKDWKREEMNILILGETGVGKSTWINGFQNFIKHSSMAEAEKGELHSLIPSTFTVCNEKFEEITVVTGDDSNESQVTGQSATQDARIYRFKIGNTQIQLIDTPGVGDTRGLDQDKINFQNILSTLENIEEIHGICILLKPNNARLTVMFRFCIKELLTYLHRDAAKNIMFCFTNSRGTFYRPGDTMPALKQLLLENKDVKIEVSQNTVYCFDSEAYRFLAAVKNHIPVKFDERETENFANSWDMSMNETLRMLGHINDLKPHPIRSTVNLNHAREVVLKLTRPLAEISRNIQTNMAIIKDEQEQIANSDAKLEDLKKRRRTKRTQIEVKKLDYPRTVCGNKKCVKVWKMGMTTQTEYTSICHEHCHLTGVQRDSFGDPGLMNCYAFNSTSPDNCRNCSHKYQEHLHVYYESIQVEVEVKDETVEKLLNREITEKQAKKLMLEARNREIAIYKKELEQVERASAKFACFLRHNAITPYNDEMDKYLNHLIRQEEDKAAITNKKETLESLQKNLESYRFQKKVLEEAMMQGDGSKLIGPHDIEQLVNDLKNMKISGGSLQDALNCVEKTKKETFNNSILNNNFRTSNTYRPRNLIKSGYKLVRGLLQN